MVNLSLMLPVLQSTSSILYTLCALSDVRCACVCMWQYTTRSGREVAAVSMYNRYSAIF
jgi:hypothetical protein